MRQSGILAACGLISLNKMTKRLAEDHANAKHFACSLQGLTQISVDCDIVETNMVMVQTAASSANVQQKLGEEGILCLPTGPNRLRFVFHHDVTREKVDQAIDQMRKIFA